MVAQTLTRPIIDKILDLSQLMRVNYSKVGLLGQEAPDEPNRVLDRALLPAVERVAEVRLGAEDRVDLLVLDILTAVIVRNGATQPLGIAIQAAGDRLDDCMRLLCAQLIDVHHATRPFQAHGQCALTLTRDHRIGFPVAGLDPLGYVSGTLVDRYPTGNMQFILMVMPLAEELALLMRAG